MIDTSNLLGFRTVADADLEAMDAAHNKVGGEVAGLVAAMDSAHNKIGIEVLPPNGDGR